VLATLPPVRVGFFCRSPCVSGWEGRVPPRAQAGRLYYVAGPPLITSPHHKSPMRQVPSFSPDSWPPPVTWGGQGRYVHELFFLGPRVFPAESPRGWRAPMVGSLLPLRPWPLPIEKLLCPRGVAGKGVAGPGLQWQLAGPQGPGLSPRCRPGRPPVLVQFPHCFWGFPGPLLLAPTAPPSPAGDPARRGLI